MSQPLAQFVNIVGDEEKELKDQIIEHNLLLALSDAIAFFCLETLGSTKLNTVKKRGEYEKFTYELLSKCQGILKEQGKTLEKGRDISPYN